MITNITPTNIHNSIVADLRQAINATEIKSKETAQLAVFQAAQGDVEGFNQSQKFIQQLDSLHNMMMHRLSVLKLTGETIGAVG